MTPKTIIGIVAVVVIVAAMMDCYMFLRILD